LVIVVQVSVDYSDKQDRMRRLYHGPILPVVVLEDYFRLGFVAFEERKEVRRVVHVLALDYTPCFG
jgi:hypothetical protein